MSVEGLPQLASCPSVHLPATSSLRRAGHLHTRLTLPRAILLGPQHPRAGRLIPGRHRRDPLNTKRGEAEKEIKRRARSGRESRRESHTHTLRARVLDTVEVDEGSRGMRAWGAKERGEDRRCRTWRGGAKSWPQIPGQVLGAQQQAGPKRSELLGPS